MVWIFLFQRMFIFQEDQRHPLVINRPHSYVWPCPWVYAGCPSLAPVPDAHYLPRLCVGSALHRGSSTTLSAGTLLPHCCYSTSYLIALFCARAVTGPRTRTVIRQRRTFSVAGPTAWNGLPVALRLTPVSHSSLFLSGLES